LTVVITSIHKTVDERALETSCTAALGFSGAAVQNDVVIELVNRSSGGGLAAAVLAP
jgi:hypothetical protein